METATASGSFCSDRFRTMINVLGDALAAGIIAHLCRKDFPLSQTGKVQTLAFLIGL